MKKIRLIILLCSFAAAIFCINGKDGGLYFLPLLPLMYGLLFYFMLPKNLIWGAGQTILHIVSFFRYVVYPIMLKLEDFPLKYNPSLVQPAIFYMLLEMIVIFIVVNRYFKYKPLIKQVIQKPVVYNSLLPIAFFVYIVLASLYPQVYVNKHFILNSSDINIELEEVSGIWAKSVDWAEFFLRISLFSYFLYKYITTGKNRYINLSFIPIFITCLWYGGNSRLSLLVPIVAGIFTLVKAYGFQPIRFKILLIFAFGVLSVVALSLEKFFGSATNQSLDSLFDPKLLNAYFGGIDNVCAGIEAYNTFGSSVLVFIIDTFRNMMVMSKTWALIPTNTLAYFNFIVYEGVDTDAMDQIVPTITQGMMYFSPVLCFIPTAIMTYVICAVDRAWFKTNNVYIAFMLVSFATMVGWAVPGSWMHMSSRILNNVIPTYILILLVDKFFNKKPLSL